ncbi:MAG: DUF4215 domain-containing protein, partial [Deltaproteobacteria bacterium]|nr:DUF4215 domain-containing protein [Deltaproteobacteria bacterium]
GSDRDPLCVDEDYDGFYTSAYAPGGTDCGEEDCLDTDASAYPGAIEILGDGVDQNCDGLDPAGAVCGDGRWDSRSEECDDANTSDGDGCAADCTIESGYTCKNAPDLNTGSNDNGDRALAGTHDRIWRWSETLDGVLHPAVVSGNCAAFAWEGAPSYADWINRYGCDVSTPPETTTFYVATFELSSVEVAAHTVLNGTFWADNSVFDVYVNGYSTGISFGPDGYSGTGVSFGDWPSSLYRAGENEIAIEVYNAAGDLFNPDGLLVTLENSHGVGSDCQVSCGDGVLETWEACDDGNTVSGDGCSEYCQEEAIDRDGDLVTVGGGDCDDTDPSIYPGATELPDDGIDQDCDGVDTVCDEDGDGFQAMSCGGYDCDDTDASINPAAVEIPGDGIDQNCDTSDLDPMCVDEDYDGYYTSTYAPLGTDCGEEDCVDTDETIYPGATEIPNDGIDQDCDGSDSVTTCEDADGDGHTAEACGGDDCDDTDDGVYPGATDIPGDGIDQDCDGSDAATGCDDADGDAYTDAACGGDDCDDTDPTIHPGAVEIVNDDIDQDCDGGDTTQWLQGGCSTTGTGGMSWFGLGLLAIVGLRRKGVRA